MKIGINGFGRIGRLVLRILWERKDIEITHINEISGNSLIASHLLEFDSVHGRWNKDITSNDNVIMIEGKKFPLHQQGTILMFHGINLRLILFWNVQGKINLPKN